MKNLFIYFLFIFSCSCAVRKLQIPTIAIDINTGDRIKKKSIQLEKGKICYIYTPQYDNHLIVDSAIFKNTELNSFFPANGRLAHSSFNGSASRSAKVDTVINNALIVRVALQEALINSPIGFQYQYVLQNEIVDTKGEINTLIVHKKFNPDIIINLKSLSLKISGDANTGYTEVQSKPGNVNDGLYAYSTTTSNSYGNILMDYKAVWEIQNVNDSTKQFIRETGRYVSAYHDNYSINEEIVACAKKIGKEFSGLFKNSYHHVL